MRACQRFLFLCSYGGRQRHRAIFDVIEFAVEAQIRKTHSSYADFAFSLKIGARLRCCREHGANHHNYETFVPLPTTYLRQKYVI